MLNTAIKIILFKFLFIIYLHIELRQQNHTVILINKFLRKRATHQIKR